MLAVFLPPDAPSSAVIRGFLRRLDYAAWLHCAVRGHNLALIGTMRFPTGGNDGRTDGVYVNISVVDWQIETVLTVREYIHRPVLFY